MYDPFEGIEPAENQTNNSGSSGGSDVYDPFGEIEPYKPQEETSFLDKVKSFGQKVYEQADRTTTNIENALPSYIGKVEKAADAYGQEVSQAATRAYEARAGGEDINDEDPTSGYEGQNYDTAKAGLYDAAVGTPAGYVAITPFAPAPVRGAAGLLAAPTIVNGTMNAYDQNVANDDGTPVISTAKQTLLDPVIDPVKEAVTQPGKYVQEIVDNPLNVWDKVFLPASMVEGAVKGGEKLVPGRVKEKAKAKMDSARDLRGEDVSRGGATGFDDLARDGEGVKAMRSDVYDPFGDVEPASRGGSTGFDDLARASNDNAASYDAPPADVSAPVFNVAGDADWAGMNDSTKDWQGTGSRAADMADDTGYGFDDGMRDASDMADDSGGMYEETGDMATDVYNRYRQDGLTDAEAAGMTGNIAQESDFNTGAVSGDGYGTRGLIQWDGDRYARFEKWCDDNGRDPSDWRAQVDYSVEEMKTTEPDALRRMRERGDDLTPEEAAQIIREDYERPDPAQANDARRMDVARRVYDQGGRRQSAPLDDGEASRSSGGENGVIETGDRGGNLNFDEPAPSDRVQAMRDTSERTYEKSSRAAEASADNRAFPDKKPSRAPGIDDLDGMNEKEKFEQARAETKELNDGVEDYAGYRVRVQFEGQNKLAADKAVDAFEYGDKSPKSISEKRAAVSRMVKNTIKDPDMAIKNEQGGKTYVKTFYGQDFSEVTVKVGTDAEGNGHIVVTRKAPGHYNRNLLRNSERPTPDEIEEMNRANIPEDVRREVDSRDVQRMDTIRSMRNDVDYTAHEDTGVPVTRQGIVDYVNRLFNATIRTGRTVKGARGQFDTLSHVIRTQNFAEPRVIAHELGHFLDERFHFSEAPAFSGELLHLVKDRFENGYDNLDVSGKMAEGFAEFFHDYVTDRTQARRNAPEFYNYFEKKLHQDPKLTGATNKLTDVMYKWNHQGAVARVKGHISFASDSAGFQGLKKMLRDGTFGEAGKKAWSRLYTEAVDELHPLSDVVADVEKRIGRKLPFSANPFLNAWAARGWAGKAITLLQHGDPERGIPALKDIFHSIGKKNLKDFSAFLVALREKDIYDFNSKLKKGEEGSALKATMDPIDAGMTIRELAKKHPEFVEAAKELYRYQQHLINELVNAGMLSAKAAADMRKRWPHYVPFQRIVDGIDAPSVGGKKFVNVGNTIQKFKGSSRDIVDPLESVISNTFRVVSAIERNKVGQSFVKLSRMKGMGDLCEEVKGTPRATDSTFYVWEGGKKKTYATSPELLDALKMTNQEGMSTFVKVLRVPAGWLRSGATLSPEFILRNPVRDMISASLYSKHGFIPVWDTVRGLSLYLKKGKEYWDYMNSGAAQSAMVSLDRDYLHGQMRDLLKKKSVLSMCANPIEALRAFSEATEMATRLAEFDLAKKGYTGIGNRLFGNERKPLSNTEAGIEARDVTLDFGRHGRKTQSWNQMVAFFNASIQGTDKMIREFKEHPAQMTMKTFIGITLPSVLLWYLNKDDPRYQELPQWQKDIFWVIPGKDTLYKIPKPFELGILFGTVPERVMQYMYDKEKGRNGPGFKGLGESITSNLLPSAIPTGFLPAVEWISNYSMFMGRNIVPLSQSKLPDRQQYGPYTSYLARKLGNAFNLSPRKIDNTIQDVGGNLAALGNSLIDQAAGLSETRPAKRASEMPGVRGFTATPYASSDSVQRLRDDFSQQEKLYNEFKMTKKKPEGYDGAKYIKYKAAMDAMNNTYRAERKVMESKRLNSAEKRERIDRIKMQQTNIARRALGLSKVSNE